MSSNSISTYKFKPFQFTEVRSNVIPPLGAIFRLGYQVVCNNDAYLLSFPSFNARMNDTKLELWKYCFDLGDWKIINCKNVTQEIISGPVTLYGNFIIVYGGTGVPSGGICSKRIYLGNLANEYKENGLNFIDIEESGDVPLKLYGLGVVMDGKYIYSIGNTSGYKNEMDVYRFDLITRKWELLYKSVRINSQDHNPRLQHKVVFSNGRIYIFGGKRRIAENIIHYGFSKIHMFDVATKKWQLLSAKHDHREPEPGYPTNRNWPSYVQCPEKSNLVYICGGFDDSHTLNDVWRIDFDTLQWEKLTQFTMPRPVYLHSTAITPSGRMHFYGGIVSEDGLGSFSNDVTNAWIKIPKLKDICWEAMLYYFKQQIFNSSDEYLKKIGIPQEYYERIIEARRIR